MRRLDLKSVLAVAMLAALPLAAVPGPPARAAGTSAADEPWVFVVVGDTPEDKDFLKRHLNFAEAFEQGPDENPDFFYWLATHQENYAKNECQGASYPSIAKIGRKVEAEMPKAMDWLLNAGFTEADIADRPHGPRVAVNGSLLAGVGLGSKVKRTGGDATYIFCSPDGAYMSTERANTSHRTAAGSQTIKLIRRPEVFYMSAVHELTHLVQFNLQHAEKGANRPDDDWILEATADATGMFATKEKFAAGGAVTPTYGPYSDRFYRRFFLSRPYQLPLNFAHGADRRMRDSSIYGSDQQALLSAALAEDASALGLLGYKTNGFWYHVVERYLDGKPARLKPLYRGITFHGRHPTRVVDRFLDSVDGGAMKGLEHVFPQFLAEYASWWQHRFDHPMPESKWERIGFGGCETARLTPEKPSAVLHLTMAEYAGRCLKVTISPDAAKLVPDLQIRTQATDNGADEIYLGQVSARNLADARLDRDCYEIASRHLVSKPAPCLVRPTQGVSGGAPDLSRFFTLFELKNASGKPVELEFVAARVPQDMHEVEDDLPMREIDVALSLDFATSNQSASATGSGSAATGKQAAGRPAVPDYGAKNGRQRMMPHGDTSFLDATPRDFLAGRVNYVPEMAAASLDRQIAVEVGEETKTRSDAKDSYARVTFILDESLVPGETGPVKVMAMTGSGAGGGATGYQDPDRPSRLTILEYSDEALRFEGVAHVCEGTIAEMASMASAGPNATLCDVLERNTYRVSGTVAFPKLRNGIARLQSHDTEAYLDYVDLTFGPRSRASPTTFSDMLQALVPPNAAPAPSQGTGTGAVPDADETAEAPGQCRPRLTGGACDCSCRARACQKDHPAEAELECQVVCAARWRGCAD